MTADNLNGRDLDRACAMAMGTVKSRDMNPCDVPYMKSGMEDPHYSTDPATLDEKVRWLRKAGGNVLVLVAEDGLTTVSTYRGADRSDTYGMWHGATIHEATARLVVAVAEARAKEKQP